MKSFRKVLTINAPHRRDYFNITGEVEAALKEVEYLRNMSG